MNVRSCDPGMEELEEGTDGFFCQLLEELHFLIHGNQGLMQKQPSLRGQTIALFVWCVRVSYCYGSVVFS